MRAAELIRVVCRERRANLFFDAKARAALFEHCGSERIAIIKDSSANKCGVICSSMEVRARPAVKRDAAAARPRVASVSPSGASPF